jgi:hypothetical protein
LSLSLRTGLIRSAATKIGLRTIEDCTALCSGRRLCRVNVGAQISVDEQSGDVFAQRQKNYSVVTTHFDLEH